VPVSLALDAVLVDTADLAIYLSGFRVFSRALKFQLTVLTRRFRGPSGLSGLFGRGGGEQLLFGVEDAAGRTAYTVGGWMPAARDGDEPRLLLWPAGGGSRRSTDLPYLADPAATARSVALRHRLACPGRARNGRRGAPRRRRRRRGPGSATMGGPTGGAERSAEPTTVRAGGWFARHAADKGPRRNDG
jgi:hypothetical protein